MYTAGITLNIYSHCPRDYVCPFCLVIAGIENDYVLTLQDHIVFKNQQVTAFVSSHHFMEQGTNVLIVPNEHYENIYSLPDSYGSNIQHAKRLIALALKDGYNCDGISSREHNCPIRGVF